MRGGGKGNMMSLSAGIDQSVLVLCHNTCARQGKKARWQTLVPNTSEQGARNRDTQRSGVTVSVVTCSHDTVWDFLGLSGCMQDIPGD